MDRRIDELERITVVVPAEALEVFESALEICCCAVSFFFDEMAGAWIVEGLREPGKRESDLAAALALAEEMSGISPPLDRSTLPAGGWLARSFAGFPEQIIGNHFVIQGSHIKSKPSGWRIDIRLDAGLAFGSGEHETTRGCLLALERMSRGKKRCRMLDLGTGSGVLAIAAAKLLSRRVLASDIDQRSVSVAARNAAHNNVASFVHVIRGNGWRNKIIRHKRPYDLVFANILARPLAAMAHELAMNLAPGGVAILSGLLCSQERFVLTAHRRHGLWLRDRIRIGAWTTLALQKGPR